MAIGFFTRETTMTRTRRDDILTAWRGGEPAAVPLWELEFHLYNRYSRTPIVLGHEFAALSDTAKEATLARNAEVIVDVADRLGFSAVTSPNNYWEIAPGHAAYYWVPNEWMIRQLAALRKAAGDELAVAAFGYATISPPCDASIEQYCYRLYDAPEELEEAAVKWLGYGIDHARTLRDAGVDAVVNACDIANNHGVFYTPEQMDRLWWPFFHRWVDAIHEMGLVAILHCDGQLTAILETLASSKLDALQAIDPVAGMDIAEVKRVVGTRLCLCGNIDCGLLQFGPEEKIASQTREVIRAAAPGGAFVLGGSNAIFDEVPVNHYNAMLATWKETAGISH